MGTGSIPNVTGPAIELDHVNDIRNAMRVDFVGRNSTGAVEAGQSLGTAAIPWGTMFANQVNIDGKVIDFSSIGGGIDTGNVVVSGRTRTTSGQPDFLRAAGAAGGANFDLLATDTDFIFTANSSSATIIADVNISGLTVAPAANNTCLVNNAAYTGQLYTKYEGEDGTSIVIDAAGTEITDRIGQYVALKGTNEIMLAFVESATELRNIFRGNFFDSSGNPIVREVLSDNDTLTILSLGWIFAQNNGTTFDVSYRSPYMQFDEPAGNADDYWFDTAASVWKRHDGSDWVIVNRTLIGVCVIDGSDCIATRSIDFGKAFNEFMDIEIVLKSDTEVRTKNTRTSVSVYSTLVSFSNDPAIFDITQHLETGVTEAADTLYHLYVSTAGQLIISDEKPYDRRGDLRGSYHPYNNWRFVGTVFNDVSSNFSSVDSVTLQDFKEIARVEITAAVTSLDFLNIFKPNKNYQIAISGMAAGSPLRLRFESGGAIDSTGGNYSYLRIYTRLIAGGSSTLHEITGSSFPSTSSIDFMTNVPLEANSIITINNPNRIDANKSTLLKTTYKNNSNNFVNEEAAGFYEPSGAITGFQFLITSFTMTTGIITVYEMEA